MKKLLGIIAFVATALLTVSCGGGNTPKGVTEKAMEAMQAKDYDKFVEYVYISPKEGEDIEGEKKMLAGMLQSKGDKLYEKKGGIKSYEVISEEIDEKGETAVVKLKIEYGNGDVKEDDTKLKKDDKGNWKLEMGK